MKFRSGGFPYTIGGTGDKYDFTHALPLPALIYREKTSEFLRGSELILLLLFIPIHTPLGW